MFFLLILLLSFPLHAMRTMQLPEQCNEHIPHECGIALVRLKKPLTYYWDEYGDVAWGLHKLYVMMEKQRNRGQDGAGIAVAKLNMPAGRKYIERERCADQNPIETIFENASADMKNKQQLFMHCWSSQLLKEHHRFLGELYIGHLRYSTHSGDETSCCQPYLCKSNAEIKNFAIAGNFNMTNTKQLFAQLVADGVKPTSHNDTEIILERINFELEKAYAQHGTNLNLINVLTTAAHNWDGGYVFTGFLGNGTAFAMRDPAGIRPGFYYENDEVIACASERVVLANVFHVDPCEIKEIKPGYLMIINRDGSLKEHQFAQELQIRKCTFERIYFSRGNDPAIYQERKNLGKNLAQRLLNEIEWDIENTVFAYIPNTSETAFYGLIEEVQKCIIKKMIREAHAIDLMSVPSLRVDKIAIKDQKFRTFITQDRTRKHLLNHVYDVTHHVVTPQDTLVVVDDSIVRGITLRDSIIKQLSTLNPKKIIVVSSAPLIKYPDCYGIDMSQIGKLIAFQAAVALAHEHGKKPLLQEIMYTSYNQKNAHENDTHNYVKNLYDQFSQEQLEKKVAQLVTPPDLSWNGTVHVLYQTIEGLHDAMPEYTGDWYFTGDYPTPGGYKVVNQSYIQWYQGDNTRAY